MKEKLRKTAIIICVICFAVFSSVLYPMQKAEAGPVVLGVPTGITIGAGTYAVGALALAGLVGLAGYDTYSEEINAHAVGVWQGGTQAAKDSLNVSLDLATGAGNGLITMQGDFINFIDGKLSNISSSNAAIITGSIPVETDGKTIFSVLNSNGSLNMASASGSGLSFVVSHQPEVYRTSVGIDFLSNNVIRFAAVTKTLTAESWQSQKQKAINMPTLNTLKSLIAANFPDMTYRLVNTQTYLPEYTNQVSKTREAWESMRDAGLVLPVDGATAYSGDTPLTYNPQADTYTNDAGTTYSPGDVTWSFPQPRIRTDGVPVPGVYTDTPALTGNPAIDETLINNPAIPKTTSNVFTGTTVANPDIATGNPAVPIDPAVPGTVIPPFDTPGTSGLDFTPLMMNGSAMTNKFPFSIPFDFVRQLQVLNVEPEAPSFNINIPEFLKIGSFVVPFKMDLSFEMFDPIANIIRWGMIVIFDISLIFAIRKLLPE